ncbi:hypothetical protein PENANT_c065G10301 [Penicillium antarcticum]|uniref:Xylanolytic transcriptional activator regulatory domain-containing protein n=1 Tax=Penicillium antarcticum TaxID=416450 RepID=A0A1V6PQN0_9EURO|nr:hypothetical protein PENANT_c065G10301 [Penicillium antarcticum]
MHPYIHPSPFLEAEPKPNARQIKELSTKVREYESMLSEIRDLPGSPAKRIRDLLQKYDPDSGYASNATPLDLFQDQGKPDRSSSPSSIGSLEAVDRVEDDINRTENSRATGFLGKSSEITWLKRLKEEEQQSLKSTPDDDRLSGDRIPPHTINYHLDDLSIDVPEAVQMYWVPPREVADRLFETYLLMVHPQYPIINRTQFSVQAWRISVLAVRSAISLGINLKNESHSISGHTKELHCRIWWCLFTVEHKLGLMTGRKTAISFKTFSSQLPLPLDEDQLLEPSAIRLLENLEVREQRLNRAMTSPCLLQMDSKPTKDTLLGRSWLRSLPAGAAVYFLYQCDLTALTQEILNRVYSVECAMLSWEEIKGRINHLETTVDSWLSNLPPALKFTHLEEENSEAQRAKTSLAFHYYSTQIMLGRPCLCRHTTQNKEDDIHGFTYRMSVSTLDSAMHMLDLLPDEPDTTYIYQTCPWWCMLHYIMQTATVIILELSFGCVHIPEKENSLMKLGGKSVQWLYAMSGHSIAAHRAWQLCEGALSRLALRLGYYSSNLPFRPNEQQIKSEVDSAYSSLLGQRDKTVEPGTLSAHDDQPPSQTHSQEDSIASWGGINSNLADLLGSELSSAPGTHGGSASDMHFPYDPITGEFLRAFFPELKEEQWGL